MAEVIQYVGLNELNEVEIPMVNTLATEYYEKIKRALHNETSIKVHIKTHSKSGSRPKYSIHVQAKAPTRLFESTKAVDYDLARCLHKAFKDIEREIEHAFGKEPSWKTKSSGKGQEE
jgi:hypothetical protein